MDFILWRSASHCPADLCTAAGWGPRTAQGEALLFEHATKGFTGKKGMMPPKGGFMTLTDDEIRAAIGYMSTAPAP